MTLLLKQIFAFFKLLNSDTGTNQLAAGLACGVILGFSPIISLQALIILFCCFFFRIQMGAAFLSAFFFKFIAYMFDPLTDRLGQSILENQNLRPIFVSLYNMPIVPLTRFNQSIVMGSGLLAFLLVIPLYFVFKAAVLKYRSAIVARYKQTKIWKAWAGSAVYQWYNKYDALYGDRR
jgi:uncharacterized protein (TIGR03546 family)